MVRWALWLEVAWVGSCEWESHVLRRTVLLVQTPRYDRVPVLLRYEPFSHALVFLLDPTPAMAHGFEAWCKAHGVPCEAGRRPTPRAGDRERLMRPARMARELADAYGGGLESLQVPRWIRSLRARRLVRGLDDAGAGGPEAPLGALYMHMDAWLTPDAPAWSAMDPGAFWRLGIGLRAVPALEMDLRGACIACESEHGLPWVPWPTVFQGIKATVANGLSKLMKGVDKELARLGRKGPAKCALCFGWVDLYYVPLPKAKLYETLLAAVQGPDDDHPGHEMAIPTTLAALATNGLAKVDFINCTGCCCGRISDDAIVARFPCGHRLALENPSIRIFMRQSLDALATRWSLKPPRGARNASDALESRHPRDVQPAKPDKWSGGCQVFIDDDPQKARMTWQVDDWTSHFRRGCSLETRDKDSEPAGLSHRTWQQHFHEPCDAGNATSAAAAPRDDESPPSSADGALPSPLTSDARAIAPPAKTPMERLKDLKAIYEAGFLSDAQMEAKREAILATL